MKYAAFVCFVSLVLSIPTIESESLKSLPKSEDIFTIAVNPVPSFPAGTSAKEFAKRRFSRRSHCVRPFRILGPAKRR